VLPRRPDPRRKRKKKQFFFEKKNQKTFDFVERR
jgi:hypothetical protein